MRVLIRLIIILLAVLQSLFFWNIKKRNPKKILIAHDLLLGDTLLLAPLMKRIHEKYPNAQKYVLAKPTFVPLFGNIPYGFKVLSFNSKSFLTSPFFFVVANAEASVEFFDNSKASLALIPAALNLP